MRRLGLACTLALAVAARVSGHASDPFAACRERLAAKPDDYDSAYCFYQVARDGIPTQEAARVFEGLIHAQPANFWLPLAYGHVYRTLDPGRAERLFRQAADGFAAAKAAEGELIARTNLRGFLFPRGRVADAARELQRVVEIGDASTDPTLKARAWSLQAAHVQESGGDLGHAFRLLKQAEAALFPNGPYRMKRTNLTSLGIVAASAGRFDEALRVFRRLDDLSTQEGDTGSQAIARYNLFNTMNEKERLLPTVGGREQLVHLLRRALDAATASRQQLVMLRSHGALADALANMPGSREAALGHVAACLALATQAEQPYDEAVCSWIEASLFSTTDPRRAKVAEARALDATARANSPRTTAFSAGRHMRLSWRTKSHSDAIADSLAALDAIETLRALQDDANSGADLFSAWTLDYYWLSGRLLEGGDDGDVALAFSIAERMRARSLLDALDRSRPPRDPQHPAVKEHRTALEAIAVVQRTLMNPALDQARRQAGLRELDALERRAQEAERQVALAFPDGRRRASAFASLDAVQSSLAADEALLSFQIGLWNTFEGDFGGGSWLIAVTRTRRTVHRLRDRVQLADIVPLFAGLIEGGQGREGAAAASLHRDLLATAMAALPPEITRLVIVPDGVLHRLPFETLRSDPDSQPLGARYQVTTVPSATLWRHWRVVAPPMPGRKVLILADPAREEGLATAEPARNATLLASMRLGRLPYARKESQAIARHVGSAETLTDASASEKALKSRDLQRYDIVHLAAHAIADETHPERSAILLSPGDAKEDGLLQTREIEALDFDGRIVVLSACQTAGGAVLSGEGVLSLARSFFEAGAHAVIGSRWPLRDADAAQLFDMFYRHLTRGASLSEALKATQDEARAAGHPAAAWASLVLLGNGDLRPFAGVRPARSPIPTMITVAFTLAIAVGVLYSRRRRYPAFAARLHEGKSHLRALLKAGHLTNRPSR
jgi:tetratricopeptide (TPR) repeat protein